MDSLHVIHEARIGLLPELRGPLTAHDLISGPGLVRGCFMYISYLVLEAKCVDRVLDRFWIISPRRSHASLNYMESRKNRKS